MSFESEYLELRKQRSKSVDAGTEGTSQNGNSGASSRDDYTSEYLNLRNQRNTESFSSRVDSRVRDITKALESFQNQASKSQPGKYYSMPKLGEKKDALFGNVNRIRADMAKTYSDVESAQKSLKQAESDMNTVKGYLEQAKAAYDNNPSEELATQYNQIVGAYNLAYQIYGHAYDIYSAAYEMYKPYEDKLVNAMADYQVYMNQQQKKYDDWKGSIRDSETIQREMEQIDGQITLLEELEKEQKKEQNNAQWDAKPWYEKLALSLGGAQDTTLPGGTMSGNGVEIPEEVSREMQALLNKKALLQEEYGWSRYFPYADLVNQPDFSEKSKYVSTENGQKQRAIDIMMGNYSGGSQWDDPLYEYVNGNEEAGAYISNAAANAYGADNAIGSAFGRATESKAEARQMTDEEVSIFNYLYSTQGKEAAHEYYSYLQSDLNYRQRKEDEAYWADYAAKNPKKASVLSWVMAPTKGISYLGQAADYMTGGEIDQNAAYNKYSYAGSAMRGQVAKVIEDSGKWGKVGSFAYQTAMSMADFLLNTAITGANQTVTLAIMGTGAAADATIEAKDRGLTDDQAFALGTIAGLAEVVTEKVSLETLLNPDLLANGAGKYVLKNMLAEGSEEVGSDLINLFADVLISKDQSEWHKSMAAYVEDGKTQSEAFGLAMADQAAEMGLDFLGGALSGGLMSGVNAGIHVNYTGKLGSELAGMDLSEEDVQAFIETGLESDPETASYKLAVEMQEKLDAGKALSSNDLARLWQANMAAIEDEEQSGKQQEDAEATQTNTAEQPVQSQRTQPMAVEDTKISVAEKLRQEQGAIGGTHNVNTDEQRQRFTAAEPAEAGRNNLSDGIQGRYAGQGAAEQVGSLEASPVQKQSVARPDGSRAAIERQNTARYLRLEKVSSKELGLESGTEAKNIQVMPQEHWDTEMMQLADRIYNETGKGVSYVLGRIQVRGAGGTVGYARGVISGDKIFVQADNLRVPMSKIADHEAYHAKADFVGNGRLNAEIKQHIISNFSEEQFQKALEKYIVGLRGVYNVEDAKTTEAYESLVAQIEEEIFADAYAGINAFGANADQFAESVNERMDQLHMGKIRNQENGTEQPTGPPAERYSYAGENANTADLEALERAKKMKKAGFADEIIRQETGWFIGMDGKWRWEIDDSGMQFDRTGDLRGATSAKWAQEDLNNARDDLWGHADLDTLNKVRAYNRACVQDDANTMKQLYDELIHGNSAYYFGQYVEALNRTRETRRIVGGTLQDYIDHPALFEAYDNAGRLIPLSSRYDERNSDIRYSLDDEAGEQEKKQETAYTKGDVSAETIEEDIRKVARMESVTKITGNEFQKGEKDLVTQVKEFFDGLDKRAYNPQLGSITLDKEGVKSDLGHGMGRKKAAAFAAVPDVLARGFVVDYQKNWKGRGYDTAVVAAPIQIGDGDYLMGIVLNRNQSENKFYVHEVLTTENGASPFKTGTRKGNPSGDTPSVISILDKIRTVKNQTGTSEKFSTDDESDVQLIQEQKRTVQKKTVGPVAESRPTIAKRDLRKTVLNLFSIPSGQRAELGSVIDSYADRLIKNGSLSWEDRESFFDRMYASGVMTVAADELYAEGRNYLKGGRIYVSDSVVADLGDDWNDIRRRAFAAGIYLTRSRMTNNVQNMGIDGWNDYLASDLPGLFNSEETDQRSILERIIQVAEEGKDEKMSLPEYTAWLAETEHQSEDEFLDNMERQMDWALRTFAEKANLEVTIKDRTEKKIANDREVRKESARKAQQNKELRELQQKTLKQLQWLNRNRNRAPEELKSTWDEVLSDIDLYAVGAANEMNWSDKYNATWKDLAQMYKDAQKNDPNFLPSKELERIVTRLDGTKIEDMDLGALQDLYKAAIGLRTEFYNRNNIINDEQQRLFAEVYTDAKREIEAAPGKYTGNPVGNFINLDQLTPMNVMQRMGGWDPDGAFYSMAKQLERGERDMRAYTVKANRMLQDFLTEHENWVKRADGQGKDAIWYELEVPELLQLGMGDKPIFGDTVKVYMTPAQKVHMYLESKNVDNLRHMTGGRTFVDKDLYSKGKRKEAFSQGKTVRLAPETVKKIVSDLTPEELELARVLEQYYNSFATKEINKVSNVLYGYDKAMGKNYAPIYTNRNYTKTEFGVFDTTAEGVGNLKGRQYAVNPSYNISALDAFERHVDQTARFCGMAIPARNWTTLMNWREKNNSTGDVITHKWGEESKNYISDLITRLQSGDDYAGDTISKGVDKLMSNYISAVFGANPSIVLKQLGSIPLASAYLDAKNFPSVSQIRSIDRNLISKYTQDLEWRTMGYSMPETKQLKENPNWTQSNKVFGLLFGGDAITAMDGWAASVLWPWAENKVRRENTDLEIGNNAQIESGESPFYKKVAEEFENAVARSQSTSDEIHQGTLRKSKNPFTRAFTMFRSDSAQTYNTLRQKIGEAQYYARTGAKQNTIRMAKKAVGSAFLSAVVGYMWAEGVEFLMNLWKHKGKKYRDDDDELTAGSVIGEMVSGLVGDMAGVVTGGEELYDFIGGILTDGTWFGIDTMGMEQLNDCLESIFNAGKKIRDIVADGKDVLENGGDLGEYFRRHGNDMMGGIKDLAMVVATYFPGLPVNNLEAYLMGAVKWVSPDIQTAYEDLLGTAEKNGLNGLEGDALTGRIGSILDNRKISESDETAQILGDLYAAGYKAAVPGDTPASVSVNGETRKLGAYQQQTYDMVWGSVVADALDEMIYSDSFSEADQKTQAKMLSNLYSYAAERAKAELFDEYEMNSSEVKNAEIVAAGASVAECITWNTVTGDMKSGEKAAELASWNLPDKAKRAIFRNKISDSREDTIAAFRDAGLSFNQFLQTYSKYSEINNMDMKAGEKAVEFSSWINRKGYTSEQAAVIKDELKYFNMTPASAGRYDELVSTGMDLEDAYNLVGVLNGLEPEEGKIAVNDMQRWRASVDFSNDIEDQLNALYAVMDDKQFAKVEIAYDFGVTPDAYVTLQEIKSRFDADGNEYYSNAEIKAAIDSMSGLHTKEQKAALWQLATGSKSAKNNPYSREIGQKVIDAREAKKESEAFGGSDYGTGEVDSFSKEIMDQLLGRG